MGKCGKKLYGQTWTKDVQIYTQHISSLLFKGGNEKIHVYR